MNLDYTPELVCHAIAGQVNLNFYLPDTILTCPAKDVIQ